MEHISHYIQQERIHRSGFHTSFEVPLGLLQKREHLLRRGSIWITIAMLAGITLSIGLGVWVSSIH